MERSLQHQWQQLNLAGQPPSQRGGSLVFDQKRQQTVLVVGGETWLWDGHVWSKALSRVAPPARNTAHLVYDTTTACVLLFGGVGLDGTPLNDVWLWDGTLWTEQHPAQRPFPVGGAALACDQSRQQVVLFGGIRGFDGANGSNRVGTFSQSTWTWDGSTWTELPGNGGPPARTGGQLIYDEARQQTLLFGGNGVAGSLTDMWLWQGDGWQQLFPTRFPPVPARVSVTFHAQLQQVLLLAELIEDPNPFQRVYQTWTWNGLDWSQYASEQALPGSVEGFAYDHLRNTVVACIVTGSKALLANKQTGGVLPELALPTLASGTWIW